MAACVPRALLPPAVGAPAAFLPGRTEGCVPGAVLGSPFTRPSWWAAAMAGLDPGRKQPCPGVPAALSLLPCPQQSRAGRH